jgi:hypothetical protein
MMLSGQLRLIFFGLRRVFRPLVRIGLRVADGLGQHLAQLSLRLRWCPGARCLPVSHDPYVGMPEGELNPSGDRKSQGWRRGGLSDDPIIDFGAVSGVYGRGFVGCLWPRLRAMRAI